MLNGTQLIWVVLLTVTFRSAILITPVLLTIKSQNSSTYNSGRNTDSGTDDFIGYCMNCGYCFYLKEQQTVACKSSELYGGKRWEKLFWYT